MNRKLKKYAEKQMAQYRNDEFLEELKSCQREKKNQHVSFNKKVVSLCVYLSVAIITLTVALLCVFLIKPTTSDAGVETQTPLQAEPIQEKPTPQEVKPGKGYLEENLTVEDCGMEEVNSSLYYLSFLIESSVKKNTDKLYNETLFYQFGYTCANELANFKFKICVNPDYKMVEMDEEYEKEGTVASYEIQYSETVNFEDDIYFFTESAKITTDREIILIDAEIIGFEENSNFIEILNEIIQAK